VRSVNKALLGYRPSLETAAVEFDESKVNRCSRCLERREVRVETTDRVILDRRHGAGLIEQESNKRPLLDFSASPAPHETGKDVPTRFIERGLIGGLASRCVAIIRSRSNPDSNPIRRGSAAPLYLGFPASPPARPGFSI
jgi:hypothetical protein